MEKVVLNVAGMSCGGCADSVKAALLALPGVRSVEVGLAEGRVIVERDAGQPAIEALAEAVSDAGFDVIG
ncbi:heavy-metal-associated domain-containing protein [Crenobacter cavernae]|uniref:Heavy-metal-associated domain-containing protein n=1 Tax=Crenobacter cavernae TaxID=2290923 RepID=A0A345Y2X0_9NEIS|nr:heavy metal-associated domain-containing protein [Crenobacter cavernae]AXK38272.1 heavy-metal-associated domain-containing protein [Crenobacter cavernae]